jgi:hypothetical protein
VTEAGAEATSLSAHLMAALARTAVAVLVAVRPYFPLSGVLRSRRDGRGVLLRPDHIGPRTAPDEQRDARQRDAEGNVH